MEDTRQKVKQNTNFPACSPQAGPREGWIQILIPYTPTIKNTIQFPRFRNVKLPHSNCHQLEDQPLGPPGHQSLREGCYFKNYWRAICPCVCFEIHWNSYIKVKQKQLTTCSWVKVTLEFTSGNTNEKLCSKQCPRKTQCWDHRMESGPQQGEKEKGG